MAGPPENAETLAYHVPDDEKVTVYNGSSSGRTA
jgi:hypothetical protein